MSYWATHPCFFVKVFEFFGCLEVINLPILEGIKQSKSMVILRDFPCNNALFGLAIKRTLFWR